MTTGIVVVACAVLFAKLEYGYRFVYVCHDYLKREREMKVSGRLEINVIRSPNYAFPLPHGGSIDFQS